MTGVFKLADIATLLPRCDGRTDYPKGTILVQISAVSNTKQFMRILPDGGRIDGKNPDKYAAVIPKKEMNSYYLYELMKKQMPLFYRQYRQGLNLVGDHLRFLRCHVAHDRAQQDVIARMLRLF